MDGDLLRPDGRGFGSKIFGPSEEIHRVVWTVHELLDFFWVSLSPTTHYFLFRVFASSPNHTANSLLGFFPLYTLLPNKKGKSPSHIRNVH